MYKGNIEARSRKYCCRATAITIIFSEYVDGWIILRWISTRWDMGLRTGLGWPRIGTGGGRL